MVEAEISAEGKQTKGGVVIGHSEDVTFYSSEESSKNAWEADLAQVCAPVYKLPQKLYYNPQDLNSSMPWDCDMELRVGDRVWFSVLESRNAVSVICEGKAYKLIPYRDCYVTKRRNLKTNITRYYSDAYDKICLNGFILLEPIYVKNTSPFAIDSETIDMTRGIVRYAGKPNREYIFEQYCDFPVLENGDEVLLAPKTALTYLERKSYLAQFDGDKQYWVVQRRRVSMVLSKGN